MYSSYGSYGSLSSAAQPLDIAPSSYLSRSPTYQANCAFPSWPRSSSLGESVEQRATSYLSDDDLLDLVEDDAHSISSASSNASGSPFQQTTEQDFLDMQREQAALQREALRFLAHERERRKQQANLKRQRHGGSSSTKKSPKHKNGAMAPISEGAE